MRGDWGVVGEQVLFQGNGAFRHTHQKSLGSRNGKAPLASVDAASICARQPKPLKIGGPNTAATRNYYPPILPMKSGRAWKPKDAKLNFEAVIRIPRIPRDKYAAVGDISPSYGAAR